MMNMANYYFLLQYGGFSPTDSYQWSKTDQRISITQVNPFQYNCLAWNHKIETNYLQNAIYNFQRTR